ncbi:MAG: alpha/beta hydrolase [Coriobacteriia bacterium]|nr:alpha/beta hydrolase [Coriobacteriia bacterium]
MAVGTGLALLLVALITASLLTLLIAHRASLSLEQSKFIPPGGLVEANGHTLHLYSEGSNRQAPVLVFLSGGGTTAPVYDFKPLYSLLSEDYRIVVVEKLGYGYSQILEAPRDIDSLLADTRTALQRLGVIEPYVLIPHSMSGLEALRWAQLYPEEIAGVIGIDMAIPSVYLEESIVPSSFIIMAMKIGAWMGVQRLPFIISVSNRALTAEEYEQARLLAYRNAVNPVIAAEASWVLRNAEKVELDGFSYLNKLPILLLVANGSQNEIGSFWTQHQAAFALKTDARIEYFDCGHYIHQHKPEQISNSIKDFLQLIAPS